MGETNRKSSSILRPAATKNSSLNNPIKYLLILPGSNELKPLISPILTLKLLNKDLFILSSF